MLTPFLFFRSPGAFNKFPPVEDYLLLTSLRYTSFPINIVHRIVKATCLSLKLAQYETVVKQGDEVMYSGSVVVDDNVLLIYDLYTTVRAHREYTYSTTVGRRCCSSLMCTLVIDYGFEWVRVFIDRGDDSELTIALITPW
jgi:hypothetical protein